MNRYKLRAESTTDVTSFIDKLPLGSIVDEQLAVFEKYVNDCEFEFTSDLSLEELREACRKVEDGHVMLETIALAANYTGYRNYEQE